MTKYIYSQLDPTTDTIRLLQIERGWPSDPINCRLFDSYPDQERGPAYKALSYTWGEPEPKFSIHIDGYQFCVSENLYSALKDIRRPNLEITLWADAICINQDNDEEKGFQVQQMGNIYKGAEEVLIWLGPSNDSIITLMEFITWVHEKATSAKTIGTNEDWSGLCRRLMTERFWSPGPDTHSRSGQVLLELLRRPWFERVWILQEVANAKSAKVMCGSTACSSRTFAVMPSLMGLEVDEHTQAVLDIMPGLRKNTWWSSTRYLHFLLVKFAESKATLTRDKIYALLGISEDAKDLKRFYPCYQKDDRQVLRDTLCFLLFGEILDSSFSFPDITIEELSHPIPQLATRTLLWTVNQRGGLLDSARQTAILLVKRINEGQLKRADFLSSLAEAHADNHELQSILSNKYDDINLTLTFETLVTLKITSGKGSTISARLVYATEQYEASQRARLVSAPFGESEDMTKTIQSISTLR